MVYLKALCKLDFESSANKRQKSETLVFNVIHRFRGLAWARGLACPPSACARPLGSASLSASSPGRPRRMGRGDVTGQVHARTGYIRVVGFHSIGSKPF